MHSLKMGVNGILGSDGTVKGIVRSNQVWCGDPTTVEVTNIAGRVEFLVRVGPGHALLWGADVDLVILSWMEMDKIHLGLSINFNLWSLKID